MNNPAPRKFNTDYVINHQLIESSKAELVVTVLTDRDSDTFTNAIESICLQRCTVNLAILLVADNCSNSWIDSHTSYFMKRSITVIRTECGSAWKARNTSITAVAELFPKAKWIARLDDDDILAGDFVLQTMWNKLCGNHNALWAIAGNYQSQHGIRLSHCNLPCEQLVNPSYLLKRIRSMSNGDFSAELPSCNLWIRNGAHYTYPPIASAEDHWLLTFLLIEHPNEGVIFSDLVYSTYDLGGSESLNNKNAGEYSASRRSLYRFAQFKITNELVADDEPTVLGWGKEGIIIHSNQSVEKQFLDTGFLELTEWHHWFKTIESTYLPQKTRIVQSIKHPAVSYPFDSSSPAKDISKVQVFDFICDTLTAGYVVLNVARKNFRIKNNKLYFIDLGTDIRPLNHTYFIDMCIRLYLIGIRNLSDIELSQITLRFRNNIDFQKTIPGLEFFLKQCFSYFHQKNCFFAKPPFISLPKIHVHTDVTVLIKVCGMDHRHLQESLSHIVNALKKHDLFSKIVVLIDPYRGPFPRQHDDCRMDLVVKIVNNFLQEKRIDQVLTPPDKDEVVRLTNQQWFNIDSTASRTINNIPVYAHLWGFDQIDTPFLFQMDCDIFFSRRDGAYDVIGEMKTAIISDPSSIGAGYNIPRLDVNDNRPWQAEIGKFVPEVRCGLLYLPRFKSAAPYDNGEQNKQLQLSWYRSVEKSLAHKKLRFLRGGRGGAFYIHPMNSQKKDLTLMSKVRDLCEQGIVPVEQSEKWDLLVNNTAWKYTVRREKVIFLCLVDSCDLHWLRAQLNSISAQTSSDWGCIVLNCVQDRYIGTIIREFYDRNLQKVTTISCDYARAITHLYDCIGEFDSKIIPLFNKELLLNKNIVTQLHREAIPSVGVIPFYSPLKMHQRLLANKSTIMVFFNDACSDHFYRFVTQESNVSNDSKPMILSHAESEYNENTIRKTPFIPNLKRIEIDLTYACTLSCTACTRSCSQAPSTTHISVDAIKDFIQTTESKNYKWERVALLGGEPTQHPQFLEIVELLDNWFNRNSPSTELKVVSNGVGEFTQKQLAKIPPKWVYTKSFKTNQASMDYFEPFNNAPIDSIKFANHCFLFGCWISNDCGIGLTPHGYFPCATAGGIERIFQLQKGLKTIPADPFEFEDCLKTYCKYCGFYWNDRWHSREEQRKKDISAATISNTWKNAYNHYRTMNS